MWVLLRCRVQGTLELAEKLAAVALLWQHSAEAGQQKEHQKEQQAVSTPRCTVLSAPLESGCSMSSSNSSSSNHSTARRSGDPHRSGWRDIFGAAFDVFGQPTAQQQQQQQRHAPPALLSLNGTNTKPRRARGVTLDHDGDDDTFRDMNLQSSMTPGGDGDSWLLSSTRTLDAGRSVSVSGTEDEADEHAPNKRRDRGQAAAQRRTPPPIPPRPPALSAPSTPGAAAAAPVEAPVPHPSPLEHEAQLNEVAARAAQADQIASVAAAYRRGQLIPVIRETPHELLAASPLPSPASDASSSAPPSNEATAFGDLVCPHCTDAQPCAWAAALTNNDLERLRHLVWSDALHSAHRGDVWIALLVGTDPAVHTAWERYYAALLASASAPVAIFSPRLIQASLRQSPTSSPSHSPQATPSPIPSPLPTPAQPHSRAQFTATAFGELLKDVERTLPTLAFFAHSSGEADSKGPAAAAASRGKSGIGVLQRLLTAFTLHRPIVGYCQSMNFSAAMLCLSLQGRGEHLAFALLCHLLEPRLACYAKSMLGCVLDARVLDSLLGFFEPELHAILERQAVSCAHMASSWLLCSFVHAPLALPHALLVWDRMMASGEVVLFHTGLALFYLHRSAFTSLYKPTAEQLMSIVLRLMGPSTLIHPLLTRIRDTMFHGALTNGVGQPAGAPPAAGSNLVASIAALRTFHRTALCVEMSTLPLSRLRRLERSTGLPSAELQRLWTCFLSGSEERWATLASGVINDVSHFRVALAAALLGPGARGATTSAGARATSPPHHRGRGASLLHTPGYDASRAWQGAGLVQIMVDAACGAHAPPCSLCVPPLPRVSAQLEPHAAVLRSCPRCSWMADPDVAASSAVRAHLARHNQSAAAAGSATHPSASSSPACTCACTCNTRLPPRGLSRSVFGRLFLLFDARIAQTSSSSPSGGFSSDLCVSSAACAGALAGGRGFIDFEAFVAGVKLLMHGERMERIRALFLLAQEQCDDEHSSGVEEAELRTALLPSPAPPRVTRKGFCDLVSLFEELYHGRSVVVQPAATPSASPSNSPAPSWDAPSPSPSPSASPHASPIGGASPSPSPTVVAPPPPRPARAHLLSADASARLFVSMAFEKAAADRARTRSIHAPSPAPTAPTTSPSPSDTDTMSLHAFAHCIGLHPLISSFFHLDNVD